MYNNKQDFVPPLVDYGIVYLTNAESFLYFLNKAYGQLGYHSAQEAIIFGRWHAPKILVSRQYCMVPFCSDFQIHIAVLHYTDLLLFIYKF